MRVAAFLVCYVAWMHAVVAAPGVIVVPRAEVFAAPSETAAVVSELGSGAAICVVDETSEVGGPHMVPGWLPVRLPGRGDVGYVRSEAIDLNAGSETSGQRCDPAPQAMKIEAQPAPQPLPRPKHQAPRSLAAVEPLPAVDWLVPLHPVRIAVGIGSGAAWLRKEAAAQHHMDDTGLTLNLGVGLTIYDVFSVSSSFGAAFPGDHASFTQDVMPILGGDATSAESHLDVYNLSIAVGLRTPFLALGSRGRGGPWAAMFADYGSSKIGGHRSIADCSDCRTDDLDLSNGSFWRVGLDLAPPFRSSKAGWTFTAAYQHYEAGAGFMQEIRIGLTAWFL
jgi:hypothetical protein